MSGRNALYIKKLILKALEDGKPHTYAELERKVNSNWQTIRSHCKELEIFNCIVIEKKESHKRNNKPYYEIIITRLGLDALKKFEELS